MTKTEFIEKWYSYGGSREIMESDLDTLLKETEDRGIERGKIIERYGSETYFE